MIDYQRVLTVIATSPLARPVRVLLAVYQFADFTGALEALPASPAEGIGERIQVTATSQQPVVLPEQDKDGKNHGDLHARYCADGPVSN